MGVGIFHQSSSPGAPSLPPPPIPTHLPGQLTVHNGLNFILGPQDQAAPGEGGAGEEEAPQGWVLQGTEQGSRGSRLPFPEGPLLRQGQAQNDPLSSCVQHAAGTVGPKVRLHSLKHEGLVLRHHPGLCGDSVGRHEANGQLLGAPGRSRDQFLQGCIALGAGEGAESACGTQQRVSEWGRPLLGPGPHTSGPGLPQRTQPEPPRTGAKDGLASGRWTAGLRDRRQ